MLVDCSFLVENIVPTLELAWLPTDGSTGAEIEPETCSGIEVVVGCGERLEDSADEVEVTGSWFVVLGSTVLMRVDVELRIGVDCCSMGVVSGFELTAGMVGASVTVLLISSVGNCVDGTNIEDRSDSVVAVKVGLLPPGPVTVAIGDCTVPPVETEFEVCTEDLVMALEGEIWGAVDVNPLTVPSALDGRFETLEDCACSVEEGMTDVLSVIEEELASSGN